MFKLDPQLEKDCFDLGQLGLCRVLLMNDSAYPWFILVPQVADLTEIYQLDPELQRQLSDESARFAAHIAKAFAADKINIAALGNVVSQLHVHHIVRFRSDQAWPAPVWGKFAATPYKEDAWRDVAENVNAILETSS